MILISLDEKQILGNKNIQVREVNTKIDIYNEMAGAMADRLLENNIKEKHTCFILPVGPRGQYRRFVELCNTQKISCRDLITINMDEYLDPSGNLIKESSPFSFRGFMKNNLFDILNSPLKIRPENIFFPDPLNPDSIFRVLNDVGRADICFGGVGINGHIAFNEPINDESISNEDFLNMGTRALDLAGETILLNSLRYGGHFEKIPKKCITIGLKEIFMSDEIKIYLEHDWQSSVLRKIILLEKTPSFPVTFIKSHENSSITAARNVIRNYLG